MDDLQDNSTTKNEKPAASATSKPATQTGDVVGELKSNEDFDTVFPMPKIRVLLRQEEGIGKLYGSAVDLVGASSAIFLQKLSQAAVKIAMSNANVKTDEIDVNTKSRGTKDPLIITEEHLRQCCCYDGLQPPSQVTGSIPNGKPESSDAFSSTPKPSSSQSSKEHPFEFLSEILQSDHNTTELSTEQEQNQQEVRHSSKEPAAVTTPPYSQLFQKLNTNSNSNELRKKRKKPTKKAVSSNTNDNKKEKNEDQPARKKCIQLGNECKTNSNLTEKSIVENIDTVASLEPTQDVIVEDDDDYD